MKTVYLIVITVIFCSCSTFKSQESQPFFGKVVMRGSEQIGEREPASVKEVVNLDILKDFVLLDSYGKEIRYRLETRFWTNKDQAYLKKKLDRVVQKTLYDVLEDIKKADIAKEKGESESSVSVTSSLKDHFVQHLLKEFVKTLYLYKILNGTFQFDIAVVPLDDNPLTFATEFSSNQLVIYPDENISPASLSKELEQGSMDLPKRIARLEFPHQREGDIFLAGNISVAFKLVDFDINPLRPIPNTKKNAVKGTIIYRKYIRKGVKYFTFRCHKKSCHKMKINDIEYDDDRYLTVDYIYNFNLKNLLPKLDIVRFYPGTLKGRGYYKTGIFSHLATVWDREEKSVKGSWLLSGKYKHQPFTFKLRKIELNLIKNKISVEGYTLVKGMYDESGVDSKIKRFLRQNHQELINSLEISPYLMGRGEE